MAAPEEVRASFVHTKIQVDKKMTVDFCRRELRNGIVARKLFLFLILAVLLAGAVFEYGFARPAFMSAWNKIEEIDASNVSNEYTAEQIEEFFRKKPFAIDTSQPGVEIRTYRWVGGMPLRPHDIHVVYTKVLDALAEQNPELAKKRFYFSASGGTPLTLENFPAERTTIVYNRNPPSRAGGAPPSQPAPAAGSNESKDDGASNRRRGATSNEGGGRRRRGSRDGGADDAASKQESGAENPPAENKETPPAVDKSGENAPDQPAAEGKGEAPGKSGDPEKAGDPGKTPEPGSGESGESASGGVAPEKQPDTPGGGKPGGEESGGEGASGPG
jgi:hypothetical protein